MRQNIQKRWFCGTLVTGLMLAAVFNGSGAAGTAVGMNPAAEAYARAYPAYPMKKSDFHLTEYITEGVAALSQETAAISTGNSTGSTKKDEISKSSTIEAGGASRTSNGVVTAGTDQTPKGQGNQNASSGQTTSGVVTPGQTAGGAVTSGQTAASGSATRTVTSGDSQKNIGPSAQTTIVTEGEKGPQSDPILGGATLTMLNSQTNSQILSVIIETSQGKLIVVDGGLGEDGSYLLSQIQARGGHVAAWLLTHPHGDHVGALYQILQSGAQGIQIDGIYYSFAAPEWYTVHDPSEQTMATSIIGTFAGLPQNILHQVSRNQFIQVDDVVIQVMNDRYELAEDKGNNASIVYKMLVNGKKLLFLGDMGEAGGNRLLAECGADNLKADIVQVAHHGQNGVGEEVYKAINPSICLWPTPQWLWNNDGNRWKIPETKSWLTRLGVQKHYVMKDGDQVIR